MKKGDISPTFQYIFVAIAGALILFFFFQFGTGQVRLSRSLDAFTILNTVDDALTALGVSQDASTNFPEQKWPEAVTLHIGKGVNCGRLAVDNSNFVSANKIIFGADNIKGTQFNVWSVNWKYPFGIDNFYYLSSISNRYYIIGNSELTDLDSSEHIPARFNAGAIAEDEIQEKLNANFDFIKIVSFSRETGQPDSTYIEAIDCGEEKEDSMCRGMVHFKDKTLPFYGKAMMYGAIFADDADSYECAYNNAMQRLKAVAIVYQQKARMLQLKKLGCIGYTGIIELLGMIIDNSHDLGNVRQRLIQQNDIIAGTKECAAVF